MELSFERLLGSGGFGEVWLAEDLELCRQCAVKFFKDDSRGDTSLLGIALARVKHAAVVAVYGIEQHAHPTTKEEQLAVIMEYVDGQRLDALQGPVDKKACLAIVSDLVTGVQAFHDAGLVHGDLHGGNVMVTKNGAKIIDPHYIYSLTGRKAEEASRTIAQDVAALADLVCQIVGHVSGITHDNLTAAYNAAKQSTTVLALREAYSEFLPIDVLPNGFVIQGEGLPLIEVEGRLYAKQQVSLAGFLFRNCRFEDCTLTFNGVEGSRMEYCHFDGCRWELEGPAATTMTYLQSLYHASPLARALVEETFERVRRGMDGPHRTESRYVTCPCGSGKQFLRCHGLQE